MSIAFIMTDSLHCFIFYILILYWLGLLSCNAELAQQWYLTPNALSVVAKRCYHVKASQLARKEIQLLIYRLDCV